MIVFSQDNSNEFDIKNINGRLCVCKMTNISSNIPEQLVGVFYEDQMEIALTDVFSPEWEKMAPNWNNFKSAFLSRFNLDIPEHLKPNWA